MSRTPLTAPSRAKLARLLQRCRSSGLGFDESLIAETGGEEAAQALVWAAVASDAVYVGELDVRRFLLERAMSGEGPAILAAHLARQRPPEDPTQLLSRWPRDVDALVFRALTLAPAAFDAAEASYDDWARLGLSFVRWRRGQTIPTDHAERIVTELARNTARGNALGPYAPSMPALDDRGEEVYLDLCSLLDLRQLAGRLAPQGEVRFDEALTQATRENAWSTIADVEPALRAMPRAELVAQLAARTEYTPRPGVHVVIGATSYRMDEALALFDTRLAEGTDTPTELFTEARRLAEIGRRRSAELGGNAVEPGDPLLLAMVLVVSAARRAGGDVPVDLEEIVCFSSVAAHPPLLPALVEALRSLPPARVHGWMDSVIGRDGAAVAALAAHHDEVLLRNVLTGDTPLVVEALATLGPPALPALLHAINTLPAERAARVRHAFVFALAAAIAQGQSSPEELDLELLVAAFDGRPMEREPYGPDLRAAAERIVNAMPAARRGDILTAGYTTAPMSVVAMLHSIADDGELTTHLATAVVDGMLTEWLLRGLGSRAVPALLASALDRSARRGCARRRSVRSPPPTSRRSRTCSSTASGGARSRRTSPRRTRSSRLHRGSVCICWRRRAPRLRRARGHSRVWAAAREPSPRRVCPRTLTASR